MCKFGDFCKFNHENILNQNDPHEIDKMVGKLQSLKQEIEMKDEEIKELNSKIEEIERSVNDRIMKLEKIVEILKEEVNDVRKDNETLRCSLNSEKIENVNISESGDKPQGDIYNQKNEQSVSVDKEHPCEKCPFIGKSEAGLKTHNTAKHKVSLMKMYTRKV